jgi:peptidoglycan/LPS O-acetylase OafA/YrhL
MNYLPQLTGLRGLAAWWIVFFHFREALPLPTDSLFYRLTAQGHLAVDFFFILSGFIIFINYGKSFEHFSKEALFEFLVKRLARIYPLHLFVLLLFLINPLAISTSSTAGIVGERYAPVDFLASLFLIQTWGGFNALSWNIPAWSISAEMGAYLIFPLLVAAINRLRPSLLPQLVAIGLLCIGVALLFKVNGYSSLGDGISQIGLARCIMEFSIGAALGNFFLQNTADLVRYKLPLLVFVLGFSLLAYVYPVPDYAFWPATFAALVLFFSIPSDWANSLLGKGALFYLGEISYSTYLIHYFIKDWVKFLSTDASWVQFIVYLILVFACSVILYRTVEVPGRKGLARLLLRRYLNHA